MAKNQTRRLTPELIQEDLKSLAAVEKMADYNPARTGCTLSRLTELQSAMTDARKALSQKEGEFDAARDSAAAAEWAFHNAILDCKNQVAAQYGDDSDQIQSLGLKKKSEYRRPARPAVSAGKADAVATR